MAEMLLESDRLTITLMPPETDGTVVLKLAGHLETDNSHNATAAIRRTFELSPPPESLVLDLSSIVYASSTGIGAFSSILIECRQEGIQLHLANAGDNIRKVFDLLGFSSFFSFIQWPPSSI
jgi:anti-anti-sigma factor